MQGDMVWIRNVFHVDYFFVMRFAKVGLAEVGNSLFLDCDNHHIPGAVNFLIASVVQSLFFLLFRSPTPPFGTLNNGISGIFLALLAVLEFLSDPYNNLRVSELIRVFPWNIRQSYKSLHKERKWHIRWIQKSASS